MVVRDSLKDKAGALATRGGSLQMEAGWSVTFFNLAQPLAVSAHPRLYVSFLAVADMSDKGTFLLLGRDASGASDSVSIGTVPGTFKWGAFKGWPRAVEAKHQVESAMEGRSGETVFLVAEIDRTPGASKLRLWVNPRPGKAMAAQDAPLVLPNVVWPENTGRSLAVCGSNALFDELRIGTEWADVTPVARP